MLFPEFLISPSESFMRHTIFLDCIFGVGLKFKWDELLKECTNSWSTNNGKGNDFPKYVEFNEKSSRSYESPRENIFTNATPLSKLLFIKSFSVKYLKNNKRKSHTINYWNKFEVELFYLQFYGFNKSFINMFVS